MAIPAILMDASFSFGVKFVRLGAEPKSMKLDWIFLMQDRYAGDIGDFVKLGLLRAISPGRKLGIAWYRYPDEDHNRDGRHISYLEQAGRYEHFDPFLFCHLRSTVADTRSIVSLLPMLEGAVSVDERLDLSSLPASQRRDWRKGWFGRVTEHLADCDLVFADPDNGLVDDDDSRKGKANFGKQMPLAEAKALASGRCAVIYHHNTRRPGGHDLEVDYWQREFGFPSLAVRANAYSPRTFFILNPDAEMEDRARAFCHHWRDLRVRLHDGL